MSKGYKVGLLDIDIHGPNVIKVMGLGEYEAYWYRKQDHLIQVFHLMKVMSTASILETEDTPIIWRYC